MLRRHFDNRFENFILIGVFERFIRLDRDMEAAHSHAHARLPKAIRERERSHISFKARSDCPMARIA